MAYPKHLRKTFKQIEDLGWTIEMARGGHWRLRSPTGAPLMVSGSPLNKKHADNAVRRDLRRYHGIELPK